MMETSARTAISANNDIPQSFRPVKGAAAEMETLNCEDGYILQGNGLNLVTNTLESVREVENVKIENKPLSEAVLESMIGNHGVSPAARKSVATRLSELLKEGCENGSKSVDPKTQDFTESKKDE